jgi:hypothetical protein
MPLKFWDEAFSTAAFLIYRFPTPVLESISPLEICLTLNQSILFFVLSVVRDGQICALIILINLTFGLNNVPSLDTSHIKKGTSV